MTRAKPFTQVRIDQEVYEKLKVEAQQKGIHITTLINNKLKRSTKC